MHAKSLQSCPTLCDPMDSSPPGSSVHRILQARILEWGAISFSILTIGLVPNLIWVFCNISWKTPTNPNNRVVLDIPKWYCGSEIYNGGISAEIHTHIHTHTHTHTKSNSKQKTTLNGNPRNKTSRKATPSMMVCSSSTCNS